MSLTFSLEELDMFSDTVEEEDLEVDHITPIPNRANMEPSLSPSPSPTSTLAPPFILSNSDKRIDQAGKKKYVKQVTGHHIDTELHLAAQRGDLEAAKQILGGHINSQIGDSLSGPELEVEAAEVRAWVVNEVNELGETALFTAAEKGHDVLKELLEQTRKTNKNVRGIAKEFRKLHREGINNASNSVTVVALLLATIAFAAIFTIPGGDYNNGVAVAAKTTSFKIFFIFNAIALFTSLVVVVVQITLVRGETKAEKRVVKFINKLMWLTLVCTSVAFMASSYIVVGQQHERAVTLVTVVGGVITAGILGTLSYYAVKSKQSWSLRKRDIITKRSGSNSLYHSDFSNSEGDRFYAL